MAKVPKGSSKGCTVMAIGLKKSEWTYLPQSKSMAKEALDVKGIEEPRFTIKHHLLRYAHPSSLRRT